MILMPIFPDQFHHSKYFQLYNSINNLILNFVFMILLDFQKVYILLFNIFSIINIR